MTTKPGIIAVDWSNPIDDTKIEYITYTSIDGSNELVGATRGAEDSTGQIHSSGVTIAFVVSKSHADEVAKALNGTNTGVILNTPTITSPVVNTGISGTAITDEDDMISNSATKVPTQQSVKAYVDSGTVTMTNKTLTSPVLQGTVDGWILANESWTYASASTITVPSGAASKYAVGDRIKWTQTTVKYGVITIVADTLLTIAVNTDYTVANAAITDNYFSHEATPIGYPHWFNVAAPTYNVAYFDNASGGQPTTAMAKFAINGRAAIIRLRATGTKAGTSKVLFVLSTSTFPTPANISTGDCVGSSFVSIGGSDITGSLNWSTLFFTSYAENITDNVTIAGAGFIGTYEI